MPLPLFGESGHMKNLFLKNPKLHSLIIYLRLLLVQSV